MVPNWLRWAREIQALAQTGRHYAINDFQRQRYDRLIEIAAQIISEHSSMPLDDVITSFQGRNGYATPRVDVRGAVFKDGKILLVRERADGGWTLPGGWADVGDIPSEAAEREVWEEAGYKVKAQRVIGVYDANRFEPLDLFHAFKIIFLCELIEGQATPSNETSEVGFFGWDELPEPLSGERTEPRQIVDAFDLLKDPETYTRFD